MEFSIEGNKNNHENLPITFLKKEGTKGVFQIFFNNEVVGRFSIFDPESIGRISDKKVKQIGYISLDTKLKGKGLGKEFYIELNQYFKNLDGSVLESGDDTTDSADRVWNSLLKDGLVEISGTTLNNKNQYRFIE